MQRCENTDCCIQAGHEIGHRDPGLEGRRRLSISAETGHAHQPAHGLDDGVVARTVPVRACLAKAGDGAIDKARIDGRQFGVAQAMLFERSDLIVLDQHVRSANQLANDLAARRLGEIECDRALATVAGGEIGRFGRGVALHVRHEGRPPSPAVIAPTTALDLHDIGAEIGQKLGT